jgi:hypothetical protein
VTTDEFERWLSVLVGEGRLDFGQAEDLLAQRRRFDDERERLTAEYHDTVIGFVAGSMLVADSVGQLLEEARGFDGRLVYFEPIGYDAFGGAG